MNGGQQPANRSNRHLEVPTRAGRKPALC